MNADEFINSQRALASNVVQLDRQVWQAASAAEALAWLRCELYWPSCFCLTEKVNTGTKVSLPRRQFFRGQARTDWSLSPTLLRTTGRDRTRAERATRLAASIIELEFNMLWDADGSQTWPRLNRGFGLAAAQHYEMPTLFLDWTGEPAIAMHFATCSRSSQTSPMAAVYWADVVDLTSLGLRMLLPPPYVLRLYHQRGFFTEVTTEESAEKLTLQCHRIQFPAQPCLPIQMTADGDTMFAGDPLLPDPWFEALQKWSWLHQADDQIQSDAVAATMAFHAHHARHPALVSHDPLAILMGSDHLEVILAYLRSLAGRATREGECYDPLVLNALRASNGEFFQWLEEAQIELQTCY